jgi:hypothetical protein
MARNTPGRPEGAEPERDPRGWCGGKVPGVPLPTVGGLAIRAFGSPVSASRLNCLEPRDWAFICCWLGAGWHDVAVGYVFPQFRRQIALDSIL